MGKFEFKCVTKEARISCDKCPTPTIFIPPVPNQDIIKEQSRELAVINDTTVSLFASCTTLTPGPCAPTLIPWRIVDSNFISDSKAVLLENSVTVCGSGGGFITINDKKQDIISVDLAGIILRALKALQDMLDFRIDQFTSDKASFDACFDHWFGTHPEATKQDMVNRMTNARTLTNSMINADGTLNENHFEMGDPNLTSLFTPQSDYYYTFAYVSPTDPNHVVKLCPAFFEASQTGYDSRAGTIGHEISHFTAYGNTNDHCYSRPKALNLALTNPANALNNADNFEFFLESGASCP